VRVIHYMGNADARVIRNSDFTLAGFPAQPDLTFNRFNGFQQTVGDAVAAFLLAVDQDFRDLGGLDYYDLATEWEEVARTVSGTQITVAGNTVTYVPQWAVSWPHDGISPVLLHISLPAIRLNRTAASFCRSTLGVVDDLNHFIGGACPAQGWVDASTASLGVPFNLMMPVVPNEFTTIPAGQRTLSISIVTNAADGTFYSFGTAALIGESLVRILTRRQS
jgi:hypothetical protein